MFSSLNPCALSDDAISFASKAATGRAGGAPVAELKREMPMMIAHALPASLGGGAVVPGYRIGTVTLRLFPLASAASIGNDFVPRATTTAWSTFTVIDFGGPVTGLPLTAKLSI